VTTSPTPQGIIFDCDGVLVDSEPIANAMLVEILGEHGMDLTVEDSMRLFLGRSWASILGIIEEHFGRPAPNALSEEYRTRLRVELDRSLTPIPGVPEALEALGGLPRCVASSGEPDKIRHSLTVTGLIAHFDDAHLFSATMVEHGKPAPDLFLHAARTMGFDPGRAVVVEDSLPGVQAGVAAGMRVLGYAPDGTADALREAGAEVFTAMRDLPHLLDISAPRRE
jgi:HAD superfamily hydrolase (TIGR01509 family)